MKMKVVLTMTAVALMSVATAFGQSKTEKFKVYGNCGMCEDRIETAAKSVDGVSKADWSQESQMLEVTFNDSKTKVDKVHKAVAKAGHDTKMHKASDEVYKNLPGCCKYTRPEGKDCKTEKKGKDCGEKKEECC